MFLFKKYFLVILILMLSSESHSVPSKRIKIEDVVKRVSQNNYGIRENAYKVYQAKVNIEKARADLLPRLNLWNVASLILDPGSLVDKISDVAPFLIPANWFRVEQVKLLSLAEKEGYRALWGNEIFTAKTLYKHILFDQQLLRHVQQSIKEMEKVFLIVKTKETFGGVKPGTAREIEIRVLGLKEDEVNLKVLLALESDELSYSLGFPMGTFLNLVPVSMPVMSKLQTIDSNFFEFKALAVSPERRQFDHFLSVLNQIKKEIQYSVFGVSNISRGVAGGVFDSIPLPNGLGNGNDASTKIIDSQKEIIKLQKLGIEETLRKQLRAVVTVYNSDITNYSNYKRRQELAKESKNAIYRRIQLGENVDILELAESSRNEIQAQTAIYSIWYRILNSQDRIKRLTFEGDYNQNPPLIDSLKGNN